MIKLDSKVVEQNARDREWVLLQLAKGWDAVTGNNKLMNQGNKTNNNIETLIEAREALATKAMHIAGLARGLPLSIYDEQKENKRDYVILQLALECGDMAKQIFKESFNT